MAEPLKIVCVKPGLQTTVQDSGRDGFQSFGVPIAGPMDRKAAINANRLVGNPDYYPVMEFAVLGPTLEFSGAGVIALTGGPFDCNLDQEPVTWYKPIKLDGTKVLTVGRVAKGCRGYLAVGGKWELESWLNSCSASPQFGSLLTPDSIMSAGKIIRVYAEATASGAVPETIPERKGSLLRILAGPEYHQLDTPVIKDILNRDFIISPQSNRMGYRLGPGLISYQDPLEIISSGVVPGTIQLVPSGELIILLADAQTTGGYPRVAHVIRDDQDKLAQMKPDDSVRFKLVSLKEAHKLLFI